MTARRISGFAAFATCLATVAACAASGPAQHGAGARRPAAAGIALTPASKQRLAAAYLAIARPANEKLDKAEKHYARYCRTNLVAAEAALRAQAAIEHRFDVQLATIRFPPAVEATASALIRVNQIRIAVTVRQAGARSVRALLDMTGGHKAADAEVEAQVSVIRAQLGLPPPESS